MTSSYFEFFLIFNKLYATAVILIFQILHGICIRNITLYNSYPYIHMHILMKFETTISISMTYLRKKMQRKSDT